jgi:hypothetical protein
MMASLKIDPDILKEGEKWLVAKRGERSRQEGLPGDM